MEGLILNHDQKLDLLSAAVDNGQTIVVDTEGIKRFLGLSVAFDGLPMGMYWPIDHDQPGNISAAQKEKLFSLIRRIEVLSAHNAVHDLRFLKRYGVDYRGKFYDTMLLAHWINEEEYDYSLDALGRIYNLKSRKTKPKHMEDFIEKEGWDKVPISWMDEYSAIDSFTELELLNVELPLFREQGFDGPLWEYEQEFIRDVMAPMMERGIRLDLEFAATEYLKGISRMEALKKELGFNPGSSIAMTKFAKELDLPVIKHTSSCEKCKKRQPVTSHEGKMSFDKEAMKEYEQILEHQNDPRASMVLGYKGWQKTTSSNYKPYMELSVDGILHPGYKLHGTKTGRLSCANPNLQQIPKSSDKEWNGNLKRTFISREGFGLWSIDYSQLQFRMTCAYAQQWDLIRIFNDATRDIFTEMASDMSWIRDNVKTLVYLILFGGGGTRASHAFNTSFAKGKAIVDKFNRQYPEIPAVAKQAEKAARAQGYVSMWTGRRRHFKGGAPFYRAFNAVIQGGEAEIIKRAMIRIQKEVCDKSNGECWMVLQIHDEIVVEVATGREDYYLPLIQAVMEDVPKQFCEYVETHVEFRTSVNKWGEK